MYAVFLRTYKGQMVPLSECILFDEEYQAQWYCITNNQYIYRKINDHAEEDY